MTRIERGFAILLLLSDGSTITAGTLARRFEVTVRTIYRDIEMLSATGVPVYAERGVLGGYRLLEGFFLPPVSFNRGETVAMLLSLALVRGLKVPPFAAALDSVERKLVAALPRHLRPLLAETRRLIGFERAATDAFHAELPGPSSTEGSEARAVEIFLTAVLDGTRVRFTYRSPYRAGGAPAEIDAEPQGLLWDRDRWYLIGRLVGGKHGTGQRLWRADRVGEIEASTMRATAAPSFDVRRQLGRGWLRDAMAQWARSSPVKIRLRRPQAERLATDWYFRFARFDTIGADEIVMTYGENDQASVFELVRWLGPGAELLAPVEWRARLGAELREMAQAYLIPARRAGSKARPPSSARRRSS
ncbi:MAG TPA: YafY family protein [Stellaceae bacterium]|nr:YafY family protein [Stellaceae bacterium]